MDLEAQESKLKKYLFFWRTIREQEEKMEILHKDIIRNTIKAAELDRDKKKLEDQIQLLIHKNEEKAQEVRDVQQANSILKDDFQRLSEEHDKVMEEYDEARCVRNQFARDIDTMQRHCVLTTKGKMCTICDVSACGVRRYPLKDPSLIRNFKEDLESGFASGEKLIASSRELKGINGKLI